MEGTLDSRIYSGCTSFGTCPDFALFWLSTRPFSVGQQNAKQSSALQPVLISVALLDCIQTKNEFTELVSKYF